MLLLGASSKTPRAAVRPRIGTRSSEAPARQGRRARTSRDPPWAGTGKVWLGQCGPVRLGCRRRRARPARARALGPSVGRRLRVAAPAPLRAWEARCRRDESQRALPRASRTACSTARRSLSRAGTSPPSATRRRPTRSHDWRRDALRRSTRNPSIRGLQGCSLQSRAEQREQDHGRRRERAASRFPRKVDAPKNEKEKQSSPGARLGEQPHPLAGRRRDLPVLW